MQKAGLSKKLVLILILIVFLDICNFFMPVPIYTPLFLHGSFLPGVSYAHTVILLGILISCFGGAQLFGGPIFGELSDQYGRKKILILALAAGMVGTLLAAISLTTHIIWLTYVSRLIIGFSSGTIGISYAVAADLSENKDLAKNIGYISLGPSFASAVGPLIGGHLATNKYLSIFGFATPFYLLATVFLIAIVALTFAMPMDKAKSSRTGIHIFTAFSNIFAVLKREPVFRRMVAMAISFQIGTEGFFLAAPIVAVKEYHLNAGQIANHFLMFAAGLIISTWANKHLSEKFKSSQIYLVSLLLLIIGFVLAYSGSAMLFWAAFFLFGIGGMLCWVHTNNIFSNLVDESEQGMIMGVSQAMWSIGGLVSSLIVGFIAAAHFKATGFLLLAAEIVSFVMMLLVIQALKNRANKG